MNSWTGSATRRTYWSLLDALLILVGVFAGLYVSAALTGIEFNYKFTPLKYVFIVAGVSCSLIAMSGIYLKAFRRWQRLRDDIRSLLLGSILAMICLFIVFALTPYKAWEAAIFDAIIPVAATFILLSAARCVEHSVLARHRESVTVVFVDIEPRWYPELDQVRRALNADWKLTVLNPRAGHPLPIGVEPWGEEQASCWLDKLARRDDRALVVFGSQIAKTPFNHRLVTSAYSKLITITNMIDFYEEILEKSPLFESEASWYSSSGMSKPRYLDLAAKRLMDVLLSLPLLLVALPVIAVLGVAIRRETPGPALFTQERVGLGGRVFTLYKLRSMTVHDDDSHQWPNFEVSKVTRVGEFIRRTGLDELPQLFNVIKGDMSFVGPRPARPVVTARHQERMPFYAVSYAVKPGISGWAQLHQGQDANDETMIEKTRYSLYYAKHFTFWLDVLIYIRTFSQLISGKKRSSKYVEAHGRGGKKAAGGP